MRTHPPRALLVLGALLACTLAGCDTPPLEIKGNHEGYQHLKGQDWPLWLEADGKLLRRSRFYNQEGLELRWSSDIQGALDAGERGRAINVRDLVVGRHLVTVQVWKDGQHLSELDAQATVEVEAGASPTLSWLEPADPDQAFSAAHPIPLRVRAHDAEDGVLPGTSLRWSIGGALEGASGTDMSVRLDPGLHAIRVQATDSSGNTTSSTLSLRVVPGPGGAPPASSAPSAPSAPPAPAPSTSSGLAGALGGP